ncbi:uncharacterized protein LOC124443382 [Xenia sp. Carnegie-2017]|uniref:uncharacterized protein LOC124443382 n=1 Tax=Xenia sp. Carnegie-2017 TaxID=2897299 RepID=UPI001F047323|nr:uncharacterized protein LOC124443382 [Xenia sp. Carnegie-2017]
MSISSTDANPEPLALSQDTAQSPFSLPPETAQASLQSTTDLRAVGVQDTSAQSPFSLPPETAQASLQSTTDLHAVGVQDTSVMQEIHLVEDDDFMFQNYPKLKEMHRSMICHDIIDVFKDPEILKHRLNITVINANGYPEKGEDAVQVELRKHHAFNTIFKNQNGKQLPEF